MEETEGMKILVKLRFRFPAWRPTSAAFPLFPSPSPLFFRKSHADWMDAGRATSASSRFAKFVARGRIGWTSERKKRVDVQSIMFHRFEDAQRSLRCFETDSIVGNTFDRDDSANLDIF